MMKARGVALVALLALLGVAESASAYCLGRTCNPTQVECETDDDDCVVTGAVLRWPSSCITFDVQVGGSPKSGLSAAAVNDIVERAFRPWLRADCGDGSPSIKVGSFGLVTCDVSVFNKTGKNANIVMFREDGWPYPGAADTYGMAILRYNSGTGELWDADVEINTTDFDVGVDGEDDRVDLQSILTHELGHFLGLGHPGPQQADATMSAAWDGMGTGLRSLDGDDVAGICELYPPGRSAKASCAPINGFSEQCFEPASGGPSPSCAVATRPRDPSTTASALALLAFAYLRRRSKADRKRSRRATPRRGLEVPTPAQSQRVPTPRGAALRARLLEVVKVPPAIFVLRFVAVTTLLLLLLFVSAVAAFPARLWQRFVGVGVGVGVGLLVVANLSRIVSLYFIGVASQHGESSPSAA